MQEMNERLYMEQLKVQQLIEEKQRLEEKAQKEREELEK
jgi:hypothetical protein